MFAGFLQVVLDVGQSAFCQGYRVKNGPIVSRGRLLKFGAVVETQTQLEGDSATLVW